MKIALYVHCFYPDHIYGTEAYTLTVAHGLRELGHEVVVVTAVFAGEPPQNTFIDEYEWEGFPVYSMDKNRFPHRNIRDTYDQPEMRTIHERMLRHIRPDIVHVTHLINHTTALLEVTAAMKIPTFGTLTDFFGFCFNNKLEAADGGLCAGPNPSRSNCIECYIKDASAHPQASAKLKAAASPVARPGIARVLAAHARTKDTEVPEYGFTPAELTRRPGHLLNQYKTYRGLVAPSSFLHGAYERNKVPAPLTLSHFGIDIDRSPKPKRDNPDQLRIGFIGQIAPHKGTHLLIDAFRAEAAPGVSLDIWGPENQAAAYFADLRKKAEGLPVNFLGTFRSAETASILRDLDVLCIPSTWYENSPLILLQALATHTPVIISDVEGMTEFVKDGVGGYAFARGSTEALRAVLRKFVQDRGLAARLSATTNYTRTPTDMVADIAAMYERAGLSGAAAVKPQAETVGA